MYQYQRISPYWAALLPPLPPISTLGQQIVNDNDNINIGSGNQIIGSGNPSPVSVTNITTSTYTALSTDYFLCVDTTTNEVTITLPISPIGTVYIVKDCSGDADVNNITVAGTGQLVDGSTATINSPYGSISLVFNGSDWSIV